MEEKFKEIVARYCTVKAEDITDEMSFRDDLGLSSLDLMTFLGDLEDEFDVAVSARPQKSIRSCFPCRALSLRGSL